MRGRLVGLLTVLLALVAGGWLVLGGGEEAGERGDEVRRDASTPAPESPIALRGREEVPPAPTAPPQQPPAKGPTGTVVVAVVDEADAPLADALVRVRPEGDETGLGPAPTGRDGVARIEGVPLGAFTTHAVLARFENGGAAGVVRDGEESSVRLVMRALVPITGRVVFASGEPAAGAEVVATKGGTYGDISETCHGAWCVLGKTTSAADGTFRVDVPRGQILTLAATLPGYASATAYARRLAPGEEVVLRLAAAGTVRGLVRAPDGSPCANAQVFVVPASHAMFLSNPRVVIGPGGSISWSSGDDEDEGESMTMSSGGAVAVEEGPTLRALRAKTGPDGTYEVSGLTLPGAYRTVAEGCEGSRGRSQDVTLDDATRTAVADVPLRPRATLVVRLETPDGSVPTGQLAVSLRGARDDFLAPKSDETWHVPGVWKGQARFAGLLAGTYPLHVEIQDSLPQDREVVVPESGTVEVVVRGVPGKTLRGRVVDADGDPIAGATATFDIPRGAGLSSRRTQATTDKDGTFTIGGLEDAAGSLEVDARLCVTSDPREVKPGDEEVRVVLRRLPTIRGRLVPAEGTALPNAVSVVEHTGSFDGAAVDPGGRFTALVRTVGKPVVVVLLSGNAAPVHLGPFTFAAEESKDVGDVPLDDGRTLRGRVVDADGKGVAGVTVWADLADAPDLADGFMTERWEAAADADGRFTLRRMPRAPVVLRTGQAPFAASWTPEEAGETSIVLTRGARLAGRVLDAQGKPSGAWFTLRRQDGAAPRRDGEAHSGPDGALSTGLIAPGTYEALWMEREGARRPVDHFTLSPGETKTVEWRLP